MNEPQPISFISQGDNPIPSMPIIPSMPPIPSIPPLPSMPPSPPMPEPVKPVDAVELLARGIVNMLGSKRSISILLVGEVGSGNTSVLALLMDIMAGRAPPDYVVEPYDKENDTSGKGSESRTKFAKVYEFYSMNGVKITVLDTPGIADSRGPQKDKEHQDSIVAAIRENIPEVKAVIVVANGATENPNVAIDYVMTTLSSSFPHGLSSNTCLLFTNVLSPHTFNFKTDTLPVELKNSRHFLLDNPLAMLSRA